MGLQISASGILTAIRRNDVTANNIANARTPGFRARRADSVETLGGGVRIGATGANASQGSLSTTGEPLDLYAGDAFFRVRTANGEVAYTRAGNFGIDSEGRVSTPDGAALDPPIQVPANATSVTVGSDGIVFATTPDNLEPQAIGRIEVYTFANPDGLEAVGGNLFIATAAAGSPVAVSEEQSFVSGLLQQSNVGLATEFTNATLDVAAVRANANAFRAQNDVLGELLDLRR